MPSEQQPGKDNFANKENADDEGDFERGQTQC
jgi:hypothetical protein